ncbi:glyoxylate/hydroxypyruvate reductase HPR3-like [Cucurbita maxima]|uniref:glyoxylate reductase (NADP(+)) n=1 Tax=Cucurbita maxima TaxID=3661 RepID=A0A6J1I9J9_CUCMA|nr:glyoxylate/hydroxypyruvate reductase HPR3-like [Cucurbita maxima]
MASGGHSGDLPEVLVLGFPWVLPSLESQFSNRFQFLKPSNSDLPLLQFLSSFAQSARALLIPGGGIQLTSAILDCLPALKLVVTTSSGLDHLDLPELRRREIAIAYAGNLFTQDVADLAVGLLIDVLRKVSAGDRFVKQGIWPSKRKFSLGLKLSGKQIGIVGLGKIGTEVAKRLEGFGCKISYNSRTKKPTLPYPFYSDLHELAANCEALIICCGLTAETRHMIDRDVMVALGRDGVIVNVGRGAIVDETELVRRLIQGELGGAGLDVFENEPEVPKELFNLDNVVLSPHVAVLTTESMVGLTQLVAENLEAFFSNKPLVTPFEDYSS